MSTGPYTFCTVLRLSLAMVLTLFTFSTFFSVVTHADNHGWTVRVAVDEEGVFDSRNYYYRELISLAGTKMGVNLHQEPLVMPEMRDDRAVEMLKQGVFDIHWMVTNSSRERELLPVRIPLFKGLIGWRIAIVRKGRENLFRDLSSLEDIKQLTAVQGNDWPDTTVLEANGYKVRRSVSWGGMFDQINLGRQDYFPRSLVEIFPEIAERPQLHIVAEPSVVLQYPTAMYFFVDKRNAHLANLLDQGLRKAIADGSFEKVFLKYHSNSIQKAQLQNRTIIPLKNPNLPVKTPLDDERLWFRL